jgi:hypothetical protein
VKENGKDFNRFGLVYCGPFSDPEYLTRDSRKINAGFFQHLAYAVDSSGSVMLSLIPPGICQFRLVSIAEGCRTNMPFSDWITALAATRWINFFVAMWVIIAKVQRLRG